MIIQSKNIWYEQQFQPLQIHVNGSKIIKVTPYQSCQIDKDYDEDFIIPGLIDIHAHGFMGRDANHATTEWLQIWADALPKEGVTSFTPAISSAPLEDILLGLEQLSIFIDDQQKGAQALSINLEGPFTSITHHGGQDLNYRQVPTIPLLEKMQKHADNKIKRIMVAPEELSDLSFIQYCIDNQILVSVGHSGADFDTCIKAYQAGASSFVHTFNAMTPLHHRNPGGVGAAMFLDDAYAEIIGDGVHVHPAVIRILSQVKDNYHMISVTDSSQFKGLPVGLHTMLGKTIQVCEDGSCRLPNGHLAGSTNRLCDILRFEILIAKVNLQKAINSVTINPATLLKVYDRKGLILEGYDADLCILDQDYRVKQTYILGREYL